MPMLPSRGPLRFQARSGRLELASHPPRRFNAAAQLEIARQLGVAVADSPQTHRAAGCLARPAGSRPYHREPASRARGGDPRDRGDTRVAHELAIAAAKRRSSNAVSAESSDRRSCDPPCRSHVRGLSRIRAAREAASSLHWISVSTGSRCRPTPFVDDAVERRVDDSVEPSHRGGVLDGTGPHRLSGDLAEPVHVGLIKK